MNDFKDLKLTPKRQEILEKLDIHNLEELFSYYPYRYEDNRLLHYKDFKEGSRVTFVSRLSSGISKARFKGNHSIARFSVTVDDEVIQCSIFNRPWLNIDADKDLYISGKYDGNNKVTVINMSQAEDNNVCGIIPIYSLKNGITQNDIRKIIAKAINELPNEIKDYIPSKYLLKHHLVLRDKAIIEAHNPQNVKDLQAALSRLKYEEFLRFHTALNIFHNTNTIYYKEPKVFDELKVNTFVDSLPFKLSKDQKLAIEDITKDLKSDKSMYRLLQGDVGSGKTIVAFVALYENYLAGYQGALMAPTEILARQHYLSFKEYFKDELNVRLLTSSTDNQTKNAIIEQAKNGEIDVIIGTHSLIQDYLEFKDLGLIITDEQHRFGVKQRQILKEKGNKADFMSMSATPIPRTLASSLYGNISLSSIETMPEGRKGCKTKLIKENSIRSIVPQLLDTLKEGRQIYIIAAAIEENEIGVKDVYRLFESLKNVFKGYKVSMLHGQMSNDEKNIIMDLFNNNDVQVLVSTTVVEVGVNVKNATTMVVYDAERFGLSQLHQLRGRVQRGNELGHFYLLSAKQDEETIARLNTLVKTNNGFEISYEDLKLRGPGDMLGLRQSGLPSFVLGDILKDTKYVEAAKIDAEEIILNQDIEENREFVEHIISLSKPLD